MRGILGTGVNVSLTVESMKFSKMESVYVRKTILFIKENVPHVHLTHGLLRMAHRVSVKIITIGTLIKILLTIWFALLTLKWFIKVINIVVNVTINISGLRVSACLNVEITKSMKMENVFVKKIILIIKDNVLPVLQTHGLLRMENHVNPRRTIIGTHMIIHAVI